MSRRRSLNPTKAISVTLPGSLLEELDNQLSYSQSRSRFISNAVEEKLQKYDSPSPLVSDSSVRQLMAALVARDETEKVLKTLLLQLLSE
jgi:metal-responsive CopG/Arc/MetJ family transcriptional regulator